jgi:hypothetical protein
MGMGHSARTNAASQPPRLVLASDPCPFHLQGGGEIASEGAAPHSAQREEVAEQGLRLSPESLLRALRRGSIQGRSGRLFYLLVRNGASPTRLLRSTSPSASLGCGGNQPMKL